MKEYMKFVIYNGQHKFTIDNASIPDLQKFVPELEEIPDMQKINFDLYNFHITSTRGAMADEEEGLLYTEELQREIDEGIHWRQETIN